MDKLREFCNYLPQRVILCYFSLLAIINAYTMRMCLDFSLNNIASSCESFKPTPKPQHQHTTWQLELAKLNKTLSNRKRLRAGQQRRKTTAKPAPQQLQQVAPLSCQEIWSGQVKTLVSVAFYTGYVLTHIPGGRLAERYGGKWVLGASILLAALLTLLTPLAVRHGGPTALMTVRLLIGLCEGPTYPAVSAMLAQWVPSKERGLLASTVLSGGEIGLTALQVLCGLLMEQQDWPHVFYIVGGISVLWFLGYALICSSKPDICPFIQREERDYIKSELSSTCSADSEPPWRSILLNTPLWALVSASMQHEWNQQTLAQDISAVARELKASSVLEACQASIALAAPQLCSWLASLTTGQLSDLLIDRQILSRTCTRRLMCCLAISVALSLSLYLLYADAAWSRAWAVLGAGAYYAGVKLLPLDMSPNYAGTLMGISNGLGSLPGLLLPYLQQLEVDSKIVASIRAGLWLISSTYISAEVQPFNEQQLEPPLEPAAPMET